MRPLTRLPQNCAVNTPQTSPLARCYCQHLSDKCVAGCCWPSEPREQLCFFFLRPTDSLLYLKADKNNVQACTQLSACSYQNFLPLVRIFPTVRQREQTIGPSSSKKGANEQIVRVASRQTLTYAAASKPQTFPLKNSHGVFLKTCRTVLEL